MPMRKQLFSIFLFISLSSLAQTEISVESVNAQQSFSSKIPAGEYSGITHIAADTFAVVSDKTEGHGFFLMKIQTKETTGEILDVQNLGYRSSDRGEFDIEGIAYNPHNQRVYMSQEADNSITELTLDGELTGRRIAFPDSISRNIRSNLSLESLSYDAESHLLWTATEGYLLQDGEASTATNGKESTVRLFAFNDSLQQKAWYRYHTDKPSSTKNARMFALGVSDIEAVGDGKLIILEREARVAENYIGSTAFAKLYLVETKDAKNGEVLPKKLLLSFQTKMTLFRQDWANYEGLCLTPADSNGKRTLIMLSDSQGRYRGVLKDWFKTAKIGERMQ